MRPCMHVCLLSKHHTEPGESSKGFVYVHIKSGPQYSHVLIATIYADAHTHTSSLEAE